MALFSDLFACVICVFVVRLIYCTEYGRVSLVSLISLFSFVSHGKRINFMPEGSSCFSWSMIIYSKRIVQFPGPFQWFP